MSAEKHVLTVVIPALNEEEAIGSTVQRCLEARDAIVAASPVDELEVVVVSDGSTDGTEAVARSFPEVTVLTFERNRGYGAAIKAGFEAGRGDWVGFLDADGTCDPRLFGDLCRALEDTPADVVLGSRMGPDSEMPFVRTLGNTLYAWMLGLLARETISDTASGMRVLRRSALADLDPLPDGLHYTPAMTARVLLEGRLRLAEVPMPYAERIGESKLSVVRDGVRFLTSIARTALIYRPARPLLLLAGLVALAAFLVGIGPCVHWLRHGSLEEWMIYRVLLASLLATGAGMVVTTALVADRIASIAHGRAAAETGVTGWLTRRFGGRVRIAGAALALSLAVAISWPGMVEYLSTGHVAMHWSRAVLSSVLTVGALTIATSSYLLGMMQLIASHRGTRPPAPPPDRIRLPEL